MLDVINPGREPNKGCGWTHFYYWELRAFSPMHCKSMFWMMNTKYLLVWFKEKIMGQHICKGCDDATVQSKCYCGLVRLVDWL